MIKARQGEDVLFKTERKEKKAISLQVSPILLKIWDLAEQRNRGRQRNESYLCSPYSLCLDLAVHPPHRPFFGYTECLSSGRETTCELMMHQHRAGAAAGSSSCTARSVLAALVGTTSQLRRPRCGRRGVKGALEHAAPETRQPWIPKGQSKAGLQV